MKEVNLLSNELAYLLALVGAESAMGVDCESLFPSEKDEQQRLFKSGYESLKSHDLITEHPKSGKDTLDRNLILFVDAVANPKYVLSTEIRDPQRSEPRRLMHYVGRKVIVEQTYMGARGYRLSDVDQIQVGLVRINRAIGVPEKSRLGDHLITMPASGFAEVRTMVDSGKVQDALPLLMEQGLSKVAAQGALLSLARPRTFGTITIYELTVNRIDGLNALGYFIGEGGGWVTLRPELDKDEVMLRTVSEAQMWGLVGKFLGDLMFAD